jgi:hypothetical protein
MADRRDGSFLRASLARRPHRAPPITLELLDATRQVVASQLALGMPG